MLLFIVFWNFVILICVYQISAYCYTSKFTDALTMFAKINNRYFTLGLVYILVDIITHSSLCALLSLFSLSVFLCQNNTRHIIQEIIRVYFVRFSVIYYLTVIILTNKHCKIKYNIPLD